MVTDSDRRILSPEEEEEFRRTARERIIAREREKQEQRESIQKERQRTSDMELQRWKIIQEETERFYNERGLVRYVSSSGRVLWIPKEEADRRRGRRIKKRRRKSSQARSPDVNRWIGSQIRLMGQSALCTVAMVCIILAYVYFSEYF